MGGGGVFHIQGPLSICHIQGLFYDRSCLTSDMSYTTNFHAPNFIMAAAVVLFVSPFLFLQQHNLLYEEVDKYYRSRSIKLFLPGKFSLELITSCWCSIYTNSGFIMLFSIDIQVQSSRKEYVLSQLCMPIIKVYTVDSQIWHIIPSSKNATGTIIRCQIIELKE